jgi:hypothetical protein
MLANTCMVTTENTEPVVGQTSYIAPRQCSGWIGLQFGLQMGEVGGLGVPSCSQTCSTGQLDGTAGSAAGAWLGVRRSHFVSEARALRSLHALPSSVSLRLL